MIPIIHQDLLSSPAKYLVHQTNCVSTHAAGLAHHIFTTYPETNDYLNHKDQYSVPGSITVHQVSDHQYIINLFGQYYPGTSGFDKDSSEDRINYFITGLNRILKIEELDSISFPYLIGCGLAGGDWEVYLKLIEEFSETTSAKVTFYKYP